MNILITGATGFVARNFIEYITKNQKDITLTLLTQRLPRAKKLYGNLSDCLITTEISTNMQKPDVVLNLAGSPIMSSAFKMHSPKDLWDSRIFYTANLCKKLKEINYMPEVFITASATGIYTPSPNKVTEISPMLGGNFIANLALDWENSAYQGCKTTTSRLIILRFGNIIGNNGGIYKRLASFYKKGFTFYIGDGKQYMPWISIEDVIQIILFSIHNKNIKGAVNVCAPQSLTHKQFCSILAQSFNKKLKYHLPEWVFKMVEGESAVAILAGQNVHPQKLIDNNFNFKYPTLENLLLPDIKKSPALSLSSDSRDTTDVKDDNPTTTATKHNIKFAARKTHIQGPTLHGIPDFESEENNSKINDVSSENSFSKNENQNSSTTQDDLNTSENKSQNLDSNNIQPVTSLNLHFEGVI
ncbi:MAG: TIGR01777 family oxidoreductase [Succinivibrionaceae bacterium]